MLLLWPSAFSDVWLMRLGSHECWKGSQPPVTISGSLFGWEAFAKVTNGPERLRWAFPYGHVEERGCLQMQKP